MARKQSQVLNGKTSIKQGADRLAKYVRYNEALFYGGSSPFNVLLPGRKILFFIMKISSYEDL